MVGLLIVTLQDFGTARGGFKHDAHFNFRNSRPSQRGSGAATSPYFRDVSSLNLGAAASTPAAAPSLSEAA
jgi:hypothetical protein